MPILSFLTHLILKLAFILHAFKFSNCITERQNYSKCIRLNECKMSRTNPNSLQVNDMESVQNYQCNVMLYIHRMPRSITVHAYLPSKHKTFV